MITMMNEGWIRKRFGYVFHINLKMVEKAGLE